MPIDVKVKVKLKLKGEEITDEEATDEEIAALQVKGLPEPLVDVVIGVEAAIETIEMQDAAGTEVDVTIALEVAAEAAAKVRVRVETVTVQVHVTVQIAAHIRLEITFKSFLFLLSSFSLCVTRSLLQVGHSRNGKVFLVCFEVLPFFTDEGSVSYSDEMVRFAQNLVRFNSLGSGEQQSQESQSQRVLEICAIVQDAVTEFRARETDLIESSDSNTLITKLYRLLKDVPNSVNLTEETLDICYIRAAVKSWLVDQGFLIGV